MQPREEAPRAPPVAACLDHELTPASWECQDNEGVTLHATSGRELGIHHHLVQQYDGSLARAVHQIDALLGFGKDPRLDKRDGRIELIRLEDGGQRDFNVGARRGGQWPPRDRTPTPADAGGA